jgi:hypothetical protein
VTVTGSGDSTIEIEIENNSFLTFETGSATTLGANLRLLNNNINIEAGATFSGAGALVVPDGSHIVADNQADIGVLLDMQGAFRPGNFNGIGRVELLDYQSTSTSELFVEPIGTALWQRQLGSAPAAAAQAAVAEHGGSAWAAAVLTACLAARGSYGRAVARTGVSTLK